MFMWMFIEGLYLHNVVTVTVFQGKFPLTFYAILGWGTPIIMTAVWAGFTATSQLNQKCWWGYNLTPYYWILEGPRFSVLFVRFKKKNFSHHKTFHNIFSSQFLTGKFYIPTKYNKSVGS